jgi:hypothetical protein
MRAIENFRRGAGSGAASISHDTFHGHDIDAHAHRRTFAMLLDDAGSPQKLAAFAYVASVDASHRGQILRIYRSSGERKVVAGLRPQPTAIAVDAEHVFWAEGDVGTGAVMRMRK